MERLKLRGFLVGALIAAAGFAGWSWLRPYDWKPDPAACCKVRGVQIKRDLNHFWVDVHLKTLPGKRHDLGKPVLLQTSGGRAMAPADSTFEGEDPANPGEMWFKFWLERGDMEGTLSLRINDGVLPIKSSTGIPEVDASNLRYFPSHHW